MDLPLVAHILHADYDQTNAAFAQVLREVRMAPLFSLMVSFPHGSTEGWPDAAVIRDETLQWACRMASKPGEALKEDCWVCVGTDLEFNRFFFVSLCRQKKTFKHPSTSDLPHFVGLL